MPSTPMLTVLDEDRHWWFATRTRAILAYLDRYVGPGHDLRVLDVGCGAANMTHHLRHYGQVVGVDNNPRPLEVARERGLEAYRGTADDLPFGESEFDLRGAAGHGGARAGGGQGLRGVLAGAARPRCGDTARRAANAGDGAGVHVPVEPQRRDQHAPAPLHRAGAQRKAGTRTASACCASPTTTSSSSRWRPA